MAGIAGPGALPAAIGPGGGGPNPSIFPLFLSAPNSGSFIKSTFNILSFYAPIIVIVGVFILSIFSATVGKAGVFLFWFFVATGMRSVFVRFVGDSDPVNIRGEPICSVGVFDPIISNTNLTYSTFALAFAMCYFIFPMILVNIDNKSSMFNYRVLFFFSFYIAFDLLIKRARRCTDNMTSASIFGDLFSGVALGIGSSALMYYIRRSLLFINETASNAEMCSMPSKQKFKCTVTQNGVPVDIIV